MSVRKTAVLLLSIAAGLWLFLLAATIVWSTVTEKRARAFLQDAVSIEVGKENFTDAWNLLHKYNGKLGAGVDSCTPNKCDVYFEFTNEYLYRFGLSTRTRFFTEIRIKDGVTQSRTTAFELGKGPGAQSADVLESLDYSRPFFVGPRTSGDKVVYLRVHINPSTTKEQREKAYGFDLECLAKIGGCKDARDLLPSML